MAFNMGEVRASGNTFMTQHGQQMDSMKMGEIQEAEALLSQVSQTSQSTLLLQKKKEMMDVKQDLDRKKEEFRMRMQRCQEKEVELAAKQEQLKENVRKFDTFLKENDNKAKRAMKKAAEEQNSKHKKTNEILMLAKQLEESKKDKQHKEELRDRNQVYEKYLEQVALVASDSAYTFTEPDALVQRWIQLDEKHQELQRAVAKQTEQQEELRKTLAANMKDEIQTSLVKNSQIAAKQQEMENLKRHTQELESKQNRQGRDHKDKKREMGEIKMAIENIHRRCLESSHTRHGQSATADPSQMKQLDFLKVLLNVIQQRLCDLIFIKEANKDNLRAKRDAYLSGGEEINLPPAGSKYGRASHGGEYTNDSHTQNRTSSQTTSATASKQNTNRSLDSIDSMGGVGTLPRLI